MSMEGQPSGGDEPITEAPNEGEGDKIVSNEEMFVDVQASLPSDKVAQAWISAAGGVKKGHIYGLGSHSSMMCNNTYNINSSQQPTPPTPKADFVKMPEFEEVVEKTVSRVVDQKMTDMRLSIRQDIFGAIRSLCESTPSFDRNDSSINSSMHPHQNP